MFDIFENGSIFLYLDQFYKSLPTGGAHAPHPLPGWRDSLS